MTKPFHICPFCGEYRDMGPPTPASAKVVDIDAMWDSFITRFLANHPGWGRRLICEDFKVPDITKQPRVQPE